MKTLLNTLIIISFLLPLAYFHMILSSVGYESYFRDMYYLLNHWTSGEMGMGYFPIHSVLVGFALIIVKTFYNRQLGAA